MSKAVIPPVINDPVALARSLFQEPRMTDWDKPDLIHRDAPPPKASEKDD